MNENNSIAVVVPTSNGHKSICRVIKTMPNYIEKIIVRDDASEDYTVEVVKKINMCSRQANINQIIYIDNILK